MIFKYLFLASLILCLGCASDDAEEILTNSDEIPFSDIALANEAQGSISQQNAGPKIVYEIAYAYIKPLPDNECLFDMHFTNSDSLRMVYRKFTKDYNFIFPNLIMKTNYGMLF